MTIFSQKIPFRLLFRDTVAKNESRCNKPLLPAM